MTATCSRLGCTADPGDGISCTAHRPDVSVPPDVATTIEETACAMGVPVEVVIRACVALAHESENTDALCIEAERQMETWARQRGWLPPGQTHSSLGAAIHEALNSIERGRR